MILPDNGKVVIIDDKIGEVIDLISGLSATKIPFVYFRDERGDDLPLQPLNNIRIVFLDLLLIDDNEPPVKKVISSIVSRLKRIISIDNGPYILIYWSTQKKKYSKALEKELARKNLKAYRPFEILSLSKPSSIEKVKDELSKRFEKFKSLKAFFLFESLVNKAAGKVINQFSGTFSNDTNWDKNLKDVLYKTGEARVGSENFKSLPDSEKIRNSLLSFSSTIDENIENCISLCDFSEIKFDPLTKYETTAEAKAKFNSRLHLFSPLDLIVKSGNIYFIRNKRFLSDEIIVELKEPTANVSNLKSKLFFLDITPVCDYSQDKKYIRFVYGIMLENNDLKLMKKRKPAFYKYSPTFFIGHKIYTLVFDFRFSESIIKKEFFKKHKQNPSFKISNDLLNEIQSDFSKYINRPGILRID